MADYRIISSDNHVTEPVDLWTTRGETKFKDRMPHLESSEEGDYWFCDGLKLSGATGGGNQVGVRFEEPEKLSLEGKIEEMRPGGYIPQEHVKDLDIDGIDVSIIYPTTGLALYSVVMDSGPCGTVLQTFEWVVAL